MIPRSKCMFIKEIVSFSDKNCILKHGLSESIVNRNSVKMTVNDSVLN